MMRSYLLFLVIASLSTAAVNSSSLLGKVITAMSREIQDIKHPFEAAAFHHTFKHCSKVKRLVGVAYDQMHAGKEPNLNHLTLNFISRHVQTSYKLTTAAKYIPRAKGFKTNKKLFIFIHGFVEDPRFPSFGRIKSALFRRGEYNVLALDGSSLIRWLYLRSTTYVRFMGEKLGEVLAALVKRGRHPSSIHVIGFSLGAHVAGFTGKKFTKLTGRKLGRITGLDPAGPCFSQVDERVRLNASDAKFVDVIHTDGGILGMTQAVGHVDYFPNDGMQQPNCLLQICSHNRAWDFFAESITNTHAFPAVKCKNYEAFQKGKCDRHVSYMGFHSNPSAHGRYYLQTSGNAPYGLGTRGTWYNNKDGIAKSIAKSFAGAFRH